MTDSVIPFPEQRLPDSATVSPQEAEQLAASPDMQPTTVTGAYVDVVVETYMRWFCPKPECGKGVKSADPKLVQALAAGETPAVQCPSCNHVHPVGKRPERKIETVDEAQRKLGYNPNLSPEANRLLRNVRR